MGSGPEVAAVPVGTPSEELVYAAAVLILSEDLYPRKLEIIREYVQNASDAIDDWLKVADCVDDKSEPQIKISVKGRSVLIFDTGIGMGEEEISKLNRIAYSEKRLGEEAGYKGIGRLAGIAVADKLKVSSTCYGDQHLHHFEFRAAEMRQDISEKKRRGIQEPATEVIQRHTSTWDDDIDQQDHYTLVELRGVKPSCDVLLDPDELMEYIGDIGPVEFSSDKLAHGMKISEQLAQHLPEYSPKTIYLATEDGRKLRIVKPYLDSMNISEPVFIEVRDSHDPNHLLAFCWCASNAEEILGKQRPVGRIFDTGGHDAVERRRRFAGLVYKLFGFSVGDRSLPERTLWTTARARAQWFTGEIHIVEKAVLPTTPRSDFIENEARAALYEHCKNLIVARLNPLAQAISDNRKAYQNSERVRKRIEDYNKRLSAGGIQRSDLKAIKDDLAQEIQKLKKRKPSDKDIESNQKGVLKLGESLRAALDDPKKLKGTNPLGDLPADLDMSTKARKVFSIILEVLQAHFAKDKDQYHEVAAKIYEGLKKRY